MTEEQKITEIGKEVEDIIYRLTELRLKGVVNKKSNDAFKEAIHFLHVAEYHLYDKENEIIPTDFDYQVGDILICDDQDEDLGASGLVLKGNRELKLNKEYEIEGFLFKHVPQNRGTWTTKEYKGIQLYWVMVWLKGMNKPQWLHNFSRKIPL